MTARSQFLPLTFERGLHEWQEPSALGDGFATVLQNWVPEPGGGLRARRGWLNASTTGAPATRRARGIGIFNSLDAYATPRLVRQLFYDAPDTLAVNAAWEINAHTPPTTDGSLLLAALTAKARPKRVQGAVGALAVGTAWPAATTLGSLLVARVAVAGTTSSPTITAPAGWTLAKETAGGVSQPDNIRVAVYYIANAASRSGTETFTASDGGTATGFVTLDEYSGVATSSPLDVHAGATSTGTAASSGATSASAQADSLVVAAFGQRGNNSVTSDLTAEEAATHSIISLWTGRRVADTVGAQTATATFGASVRWGAVVVVFKAALTAPVITPPAGWTEVETNAVTTTRTSLFHIVGAASRSGIETFTVDRNASVEAHLLEYSGGLTHDTTIDASATGTDTSPAVSDATATSPNAGQKVLVIGVIGVGAAAPVLSAPTDGMQRVAGDEATVYAEVTDAAAAQSLGATLSVSAPWVAIITAYESGVSSSASGYWLVANDDGTNFDILTIPRPQLATGAWTTTDANVAGTSVERDKPVAFAAGLGHVFWTHQDFTKVRKWDGTTVADVTSAPIGRTIAFHLNRIWVAGTESEPYRLHFSDLGDPDTWGADSNIDVAEDDGEAIEDVASAQDGLVIAKCNSLWFLSGAGPNSFSLHAISTKAGGAPGRSICPTPYGVVVAGVNHVWLWSGGEPQPISKPVEGSYRLSGDFVTTAYASDVVSICDEGTGRIWSYDLAKQTWSIERVQGSTEAPAVVAALAGRVVYGPLAATTVSMLAYRDEPAGMRQRDGVVAEAFAAETPERWPGDVMSPVTPMRLHLRIRQRGGDADDAALSVIPTYDGTTRDALTVSPRASGGGEVVFREALPVGISPGGVFSVAFRFEHEPTTTDEAVFDVERAVLEYQTEPPR